MQIEFGDFYLDLDALRDLLWQRRLILGALVGGVLLSCVALGIVVSRSQHADTCADPKSGPKTPYSIELQTSLPVTVQLEGKTIGSLDGRSPSQIPLPAGAHCLTLENPNISPQTILVTKSQSRFVELLNRDPWAWLVQHDVGRSVGGAQFNFRILPDGHSFLYRIGVSAYTFDLRDRQYRLQTAYERLPQNVDYYYSPTGTKVAYVEAGTDQAYLRVSDLGTGNVQTLDTFTSKQGQIQTVNWTPDEKSLLVALQTSSQHGQLIDVATDGSHPPRVLFEALYPIRGAPYQWNSQGDRFTFIVQPYDHPYLAALDRNGDPNSFRLLAPILFTDPNIPVDVNPSSWAPDGYHVYFVAPDYDVMQSVATLPQGVGHTIKVLDVRSSAVPTVISYIPVAPNGPTPVSRTPQHWQAVKVGRDGEVYALGLTSTSVALAVIHDPDHYTILATVGHIPQLNADFQTDWSAPTLNALIYNPVQVGNNNNSKLQLTPYVLVFQ